MKKPMGGGADFVLILVVAGEKREIDLSLVTSPPEITFTLQPSTLSRSRSVAAKSSGVPKQYSFSMG